MCPLNFQDMEGGLEKACCPYIPVLRVIKSPQKGVFQSWATVCAIWLTTQLFALLLPNEVYAAYWGFMSRVGLLAVKHCLKSPLIVAEPVRAGSNIGTDHEKASPRTLLL